MKVNQNKNGFDAIFSFPSDGEKRAEGIFTLEIDGHVPSAVDMTLVKNTDKEMEFSGKENDISVKSQFSWDADSEIYQRTDFLTNHSDQKHTIQRCCARFLLEGSDYEIYSQDSGWQSENDGAWRDVRAGITTLCNRGIRSCDGGTPFTLLRRKSGGRCLALHLLPIGAWVIKIQKCTGRDGSTYLLVDTGLSDDGLNMVLSPGETIRLPSLLLFETESYLEDGTRRLHCWISRHATTGKTPPMVYNTWFLDFDRIVVSELSRQLDAAVELGCEVFTVDAGWFGTGSLWWDEVGFWQEKQQEAFCGRMKAFADQVRLRGLGFGLWMEPERAGALAPIVQEKPEWFMQADEGFFIPDITQPAVYDYIYSEICRLIETYQLKMMKMDFNIGLKYDQSGSCFYRYCSALYRLLDDVRCAYPDLYLEGCASGGLRSDIEILRHFDCCFLSDTVNPLEVSRILQGVSLRQTPSIFSKWTVLCETADGIARKYSEDSSSPRLLAAGDAEWNRLIDVDLDFAVLTALPGAWGLSSDIASLNDHSKQQLQKWIQFYKTNRSLIRHAQWTISTPTCKNDSSQNLFLEAVCDGKIIIFAYRFEGAVTFDFVFPHADVEKNYLYNGNIYKGEDLLRDGIPVHFEKKYQVKLIELTEI